MPRTDAGNRGPLTAIAIFKLFKATVLLAVAAGARGLLHRDVDELAYNLLHMFHVDPGHRWINLILEKLTGLSPAKIHAISLGLMLYATLFAVEGVGLLLRRRWAEYLTVISTALLLPLEVWEVIQKPHALRIAALALNFVLVVYLIVRLRRPRGVPTPS